MRIRDLKQQLIDRGTVGYEPDEFSLIVSADDNIRIAEDISLHNEFQPFKKFQPDDSTLEERAIKEGQTKLGPREVTCSMKNSVRVRNLKQQLIDGSTVGSDLSEFGLVEKGGVTEDIPLHDESLPLHLYGVDDNTTIRIVSRSIMIQLVNPMGNIFYHSFPKTMTLNQLKEKMESTNGFFSSYGRPQFPMGIIYFLQTGSQYRKLQGEKQIGTILKDNDVIYCIEDIFVPQKQTAAVYYNETEIGRVGFSGNNENVFSLKLRVQHQLGIPASYVDVIPDNYTVDWQSLHRINVVPNISTLKQHGITDSCNAAKCDKEIILKVKLGPKEDTCSVKNSLRVRDLKQQLIDGGTVGYEPDEFSLIVSADDNDGTTEDISLNDDSQPLHLYGVDDNTTIRIVSRSIMIQLVNPRGERFYYTFPKTMTLNQLQEKLQSLIHFFTLIAISRMGAIFFFQTRSRYRKLQGEEQIGTILEDNETIYCIEDLLSRPNHMVSVYYNHPEADPSKTEFRRARWSVEGYEAADLKKVQIGLVGWNCEETLLTLKLRVQHQLGSPVSCVDVKMNRHPDYQGFKFSNERYPTEINVS